ncbi:hypothetical protein KR032_006102, partial [Drosophila birchii]
TLTKSQTHMIVCLTSPGVGPCCANLPIFLGLRLGFPDNVCFKIILETLEEALACKSIEKLSSRLLARRKC